MGSGVWGLELGAGALKFRVRVSSLGLRSSGFGFGGWRSGGLGCGVPVSGFQASGLRASSCRYRRDAPGVGFWGSVLGVRVSGSFFVLGVADFGFQVSGVGFQVSGIGFRV